MSSNVVSLKSQDGSSVVERFRYLLLPGRCPRDFPLVELHNSVFVYWRDFWNAVFAQISPGEKVNDNDFHRQDVIAVLLDGDKIVGVHLYSYFNLLSEAALAQDYFRKNYSVQDIENMKAHDLHTVMSMEYMTVDPNYRKSAIGFATMDLIGGLAHEVLRMSGNEAVIAPCRCDFKVDRLAALYGGVPLGEQHIHHGVPVINMINPLKNIREHPEVFLAQAIKSVWSRRENYLNLDIPNRSQIKAA